MAINWTPVLLDAVMNYQAKDKITAQDWNNLWYLIRTQGNNTTNGVSSLKTVSETHDTRLDTCDTLIADRYTKAAVDAFLALKEDKSTAARHFTNVTFNSNTGTFTFTYEDGTTKIIDTALEKVTTNFTYNSATQSLVLTHVDGTTESISLSEFITVNEFVDTDTIDFTVSPQGVVSATIKPGSVDDTMLDSLLITTLQGLVRDASDYKDLALQYKNAAALSASNASTSENNASASASSADSAKDTAVSSKNTAVLKASEASASATIASSKASDAEAYAIGKRNGVNVGSTDPAYHNNAKYYKDQAATIVGGADMKWSDWNEEFNPQSKSGQLALLAEVPTLLSSLEDDESHRTVSDTDKDNWDGKADGTHTHVKTDITDLGNASTSDYGLTKLSSSTSSSSTTLAATPSAVRSAYNLANGKANKPTISSVTMASTGWSNSEYSFESTYPTATYDISIELNGDSATDEQIEAWSGAKICGSATANKAIAKGDTPTVNIPIIVRAVVK